MARKSASIPEMTTLAVPEPFIPEPEIPLSPQEIASLRSLFSSPLFKKAIARARLGYPGAFNAPGFADADPNSCMRRIAQQQGWRLFEAALYAQVMPKPERRKSVPDNYPTEGLPGATPPK